MNRKSRHNAKVRRRVLQAAGPVFRIHGREKTRIDDVMQAAGLTRGAFYAHFPSKDALFAEVMREESALSDLLAGRSDRTDDALLFGLRQILGIYLDPKQFHRVRETCGLAVHVGTLADAADDAKHAYFDARDRLLAEMARGTDRAADDPDLNAALSLAIGAVTVAAALPDGLARWQTLAAAQGAVGKLLAELAPKPDTEPGH